MFDVIVGTADIVSSSVDNERETSNLSTPGQPSLVFFVFIHKVQSYVNLLRFSP